MVVLQLAAQLAKRARKALTAQPVPFDEPTARGFVKALPFQLTKAQRVAAWQILQDVARPQPMNRLLEGDVGSGKTGVGAMSVHRDAVGGIHAVVTRTDDCFAVYLAEF